MEDIEQIDRLKLVSERDPILHKKLHSVEGITKELIEQMHEIRRGMRAVGLAANQVGLDKRIFVMGTDYAEFTCINPQILEQSEERIIETEGCLSFPGLVLKVSRAATIKVRYLDADCKQVECEFTGLFARCFQHELDHLNGITFTDRVSRLVLAMARKKQAQKRRFR